jgi:hypothetical protein
MSEVRLSLAAPFPKSLTAFHISDPPFYHANVHKGEVKWDMEILLGSSLISSEIAD